MTVTTVFPTANYSGLTTSASVTAPDVATTVQFSLDRSGSTLWSQSGTRAAWALDCSFDGGSTWPAANFQTGSTNAQDASSPNDPAGITQGPIPAGTNRAVRVRLTVAPGLVHTSATVTVT